MPRKINIVEVHRRLDVRKIKLLGLYKNVYSKVDLVCLDEYCGNKWKAKLQDVFNGHGCPKCGFRRSSISNVIKDEVLVKRINCKNKNIKMMDIGRNTGVISNRQFKCLICENVIEKNFHEFSRNNFACIFCFPPIIKYTNATVDEKIKSRNIIRIDDYVNSHFPINWKCGFCDAIWKAKPCSIFRGTGCPGCKIGKMERLVESLIRENVKFNVLIRHLRFTFNNRNYFPDFYLEIDKNRIIIEYNGAQHYKPVRFVGMNEFDVVPAFNRQKKRDDELNEYCKRESIYFLEIPYFWKIDKIKEALNELHKRFQN